MIRMSVVLIIHILVLGINLGGKIQMLSIRCVTRKNESCSCYPGDCYPDDLCSPYCSPNCYPADSCNPDGIFKDCNPDCAPYCSPDCGPDNGTDTQDCVPNCQPYCSPDCGPYTV